MEEELRILKAYNDLGEVGVKDGGVKMIPIKTPKGDFNVWTKQNGNHPTKKVLLLHGGPGGNHLFFNCFESYFPKECIQYYYYDQLGSNNSDNPAGDEFNELWQLDRFVEEVEQVRQALKLDQSNFYLLGHSWGGILAMQYALKYQSNIKGIIVSNMMASCQKYNDYAKNVIAPQFPPEVLKEVLELDAKEDYENPRFEELLMEHHYKYHVCRIPLQEWPVTMGKAFEKLNKHVYVMMQGPSEFGMKGNLENWDVSEQLKQISTPTLVIGATHDTMDPKYMEWMSNQFQNGSFLLCENGSHCAYYDDQEAYFKGLIQFINKVDSEQIKK